MRKKKTTEEFIQEAKAIWGDNFDYSKTVYINAKTKVLVICNHCGKELYQYPNSHLAGHGCSCSSKFNNRYTTESWIKKAKEIFGDLYDYSESKYVNAKTPICIICKKHGKFYQLPTNHVKGHGCKKCYYETIGETEKENAKETLSQRKEDFLIKANLIHNEKYSYKLDNYKNKRSKIEIICPIHGKFMQTPESHLKGCGCPMCAKVESKAENELYEYCCDLIGKYNVIKRDRTILDNGEIDIYIPSLKVGIEYNGLRWHSELFKDDKNYHLNKLNECNKKGIKLVQIFEDEYIMKKNIVLQKISYLLNCNKHLPRIMARKCIIKEIPMFDAKNFLEENHIQGFTPSTIYMGCFYKEELVGVMTFLKEKEFEWNLTRFATSNMYICNGVAGRLFKSFIRTYSPKYVKSFADRRWTLCGQNNLYTKIGFELDSILRPDYRYYMPSEYGIERLHKFRFRKDRLYKKYGLSKDLTEREMCEQIGAYRIYDCGLFKYVWKNE